MSVLDERRKNRMANGKSESTAGVGGRDASRYHRNVANQRATPAVRLRRSSWSQACPRRRSAWSNQFRPADSRAFRVCLLSQRIVHVIDNWYTCLYLIKIYLCEQQWLNQRNAFIIKLKLRVWLLLLLLVKFDVTQIHIHFYFIQLYCQGANWLKRNLLQICTHIGEPTTYREFDLDKLLEMDEKEKS